VTPETQLEYRTNDLGQPTGMPLENWSARPCPPHTAMAGRFCRVEPIDVEAHAADLFDAYGEDKEGRIWTYMAYGPHRSLEDFRAWMEATCLGDDPLFHAIVEAESGKAVGVASYLRIEPAVGVLEVGHINYAPRLQRTAAATEAMYLMMRRVFDELGYRRYEWKCDALNAPSRRAARRLGFRYEGLFRQATMYKGRNRDTAWYSITDREWPALKKAYETWLGGVGEDGTQSHTLSDCIARVCASVAPGSRPG
jgi:RimJ/RimL family protein N-acetyltransferase